jgi:hypothetical protein
MINPRAPSGLGEARGGTSGLYGSQRLEQITGQYGFG